MGKESAEYDACRFQLNGLKIVFRSAKTTPTKIGQFVTLWKRKQAGPIQPYEVSDDFDLVVINAKTDTHFGQFVFPKAVLAQRGIITSEGKEGKRGFRVYPPWDTTINKQAQTSQKWQLDYFLIIPFDGSVDLSRTRFLYGITQ
ncbi:protein of unknown function UCP032285 [Flavobacterium cauense R2A-7]|nr:protein of unknown function UCP032285 [Flavobacterium cauense R2A-7]